MSFQEKRNIASLCSTLLIFTCYCWYVFQNQPFGSPEQTDSFRFWGAFILILIPVTIVFKIILSIVFSIINRVATNENEPPFSDELDKLIELKATRNSHYVFVLGFVVAMALLVIKNAQPDAMFITLVASGFASEITGYLSQLYYYRKGV